MKTLLNWLRANKSKSILIVLAYFALVILPHEWVGVKINKAFSKMPRDQYNLIILIFFCFILFALLAMLFKNFKSHPYKKKLLACFVFTLSAIFTVSLNLFVINVEAVHYVQYGIGVILIFSLVEHYFVALFIATLVGVFDEGYQYFYLTPNNTDYFDFNDIITNLLGAAAGILVLKTLQISQQEDDQIILRRGFVIPVVVLSLSFVALLQTKFLSIFPSEDSFMLVRKLQTEFWISLPPYLTFHVVQPFEGLVIIVILFVIYFFCFKPRTAKMN